MYSKQVFVLASLLILLVVLAVADYEVFIIDNEKKKKDYNYISSGLVDKMFGRVSEKKYSNIITQNIFNISRDDSLIKKNKTKNTKMHTKFIFEIRGVTIADEKKYVLIWDNQDNKSIVASEGDAIKSWQILSIFKDRIAISSADIIKELFIKPVNENEKHRKE